MEALYAVEGLGQRARLVLEPAVSETWALDAQKALRRTWITSAVICGLSPKQVAAHVRHMTTRMVNDVYEAPPREPVRSTPDNRRASLGRVGPIHSLSDLRRTEGRSPHAMQGSERRHRSSARLTAYHEAGHAVASFFRPPGGQTTWITIRPADLAEGDAGVHYSRPGRPTAAGPSEDLERVRASAVVSLAGAEVDRRLTGNEFTAGSADYEAVRDLLFRSILDEEIEEAVAAVTPEEAAARGLDKIATEASAAIEDHFKRLLEELRNEAGDLVEAKWPHVEAVAKALLEREALTGEEVRAIIRSVEGAGATRGVPVGSARQGLPDERGHAGLERQ